ncbi:hypothetical protein TNCV_2069421 [Trichonephila clavipes]|uniref:Uncharacterized protein n=1 Tax=Trichonephila clavipes TaxID=2585209 RepID=A0A8X6W2X6_TRICX|nr:hypothetical protein TNCV_2069421 [Trichonephila clavipes]
MRNNKVANVKAERSGGEAGLEVSEKSGLHPLLTPRITVSSGGATVTFFSKWNKKRGAPRFGGWRIGNLSSFVTVSARKGLRDLAKRRQG